MVQGKRHRHSPRDMQVQCGGGGPEGDLTMAELSLRFALL